MNRIEVLAQADRVHDMVHKALDAPVLLPGQRDIALALHDVRALEHLLQSLMPTEARQVKK